MKNRRRARNTWQNKLTTALLLTLSHLDSTTATQCISPHHNTINFGYYESWAVYRLCNPIWPGDIDVQAFGYTHLAFSFAGISTSGLLEQYNGSSEYDEMYRNFNALKKKKGNEKLKTLIAVGGWSFDQRIFVDVASSVAKREKFAKSVVDFLKEYGFDGIDLDWEVSA
jgi:chitinase